MNCRVLLFSRKIQGIESSTNSLEFRQIPFNLSQCIAYTQGVVWVCVCGGGGGCVSEKAKFDRSYGNWHLKPFLGVVLLCVGSPTTAITSKPRVPAEPPSAWSLDCSNICVCEVQYTLLFLREGVGCCFFSWECFVLPRICLHLFMVLFLYDIGCEITLFLQRLLRFRRMCTLVVNNLLLFQVCCLQMVSLLSVRRV